MQKFILTTAYLYCWWCEFDKLYECWCVACDIVGVAGRQTGRGRHCTWRWIWQWLSHSLYVHHGEWYSLPLAPLYSDRWTRVDAGVMVHSVWNCISRSPLLCFKYCPHIRLLCANKYFLLTYLFTWSWDMTRAEFLYDWMLTSKSLDGFCLFFIWHLRDWLLVLYFFSFLRPISRVTIAGFLQSVVCI